MKKLILIFIALSFYSAGIAGSIQDMHKAVIAKKRAAASEFCSGGELFCADFETDAEITWDTTPGAEDCTGTPPWDTSGDWCDYTDYTPAPLLGNYSLYLYGNTTPYLEETLGSNQSELYIELTWRTNQAGNKRLFSFFDGATELRFREISDVMTGWPVFTITTDDAMVENVSHHLGIYYKNETGGGSGNDGIVRIWHNTDGTDFDAGDLIHNQGSINTADFEPDKIRFGSGEGTQYNIWDNVRVVSGEPSWPTS